MLSFIQNQRDALNRLLRNIDCPAIVDLLFRIIQLDDCPSGAGVLEVCATVFSCLGAALWIIGTVAL